MSYAEGQRLQDRARQLDADRDVAESAFIEQHGPVARALETDGRLLPSEQVRCRPLDRRDNVGADADLEPRERISAIIDLLKAAPFLPPERLIDHVAAWTCSLNDVHTALDGWHGEGKCPEPEEEDEEGADPDDTTALARIALDAGVPRHDLLGARLTPDGRAIVQNAVLLYTPTRPAPRPAVRSTAPRALEDV